MMRNLLNTTENMYEITDAERRLIAKVLAKTHDMLHETSNGYYAADYPPELIMTPDEMERLGDLVDGFDEDD